jgi:uncharacterized protein YdaU (DUF1376 family)
VNFYKRYPADYAKKTAKLSLAQHGAYTLLLDELYGSDEPLPADMGELYRICRAMKREEQEAVRTVVEKFFPIGADGMRHNPRATEEIAAAAPAIEAARLNGKKGGRPKKETHEKPTGFPEQNPAQTHDEPRTKPPQSSDTSPSLRSGEERASRLPKPFSLPDDWRTFCEAERPELDPERVAAKFADHWHGKAGKDGRKLDWLATWRNWVRDERAPITPRRLPAATAGEPAWRTEQRERTQLAAPGIAARGPSNVIELESEHVAPRLVG